MAARHLETNRVGVADPIAVAAVLMRSRAGFREDPTGTLEVAIRCHTGATSLGAATLAVRALALEGQVALHRGDIRSGLALAIEAERLLDSRSDHTARAEVAALRGHVSFFTGAYSQSLTNTERSVDVADASGDINLRVFARRAALVVFGNVSVRELGTRLQEMLDLTREAGDVWEPQMQAQDLLLFRAALGLSDPWQVTSVEFDVDAKRLDYRAGLKARDTEEKTWRHLDFFQHQAYLTARVPRVSARSTRCGWSRCRGRGRGLGSCCCSRRW